MATHDDYVYSSRKDQDYELTDDQILAAMEMQKLQDERLEDDEWDPNASAFTDMDYSTFVSQRLKEVNAQWDKEPLPDDNTRHKSIEFKQDDELTSVYVPPPYSEEDDDQLATDSVDNFTTDDSANREEESSNNKLTGKVNETENDSMGNERDEGGLSKHSSGDNAVLPGETMTGSTEDQKSKKKKKKSLRFDNVENDRGDNHNRAESPDDYKNKAKTEESNRNNNSSILTSDSERDESSDYSTTTTSRRDNSESSSEEHEKVSDDEKATGDEKASDEEKAADKKEEKVLVEINGKFELISVKEYEAMGYGQPNAGTEEKNDTSGTQSDSYSHNQRNSRAISSVGSRSDNRTGDRRRAQSASSGTRSSRSRDWDASHYISPYALTPEQRELKERREKIIKEREAAHKERKEEEEKRKQEEAESAFQWWLSKKQEERKDAQSGKAEDEEAKREENEAAFNAWCEAKREQQKRERLLKNREQKERDDAYFIRSRDECEQAFKKWLKNKKKEQNMYYAMSASKAKSKKKRSRGRTTHSSGGSRNSKPDWNSRTG